MPLRLNADGVRVFDEWRATRCKSPGDERLVTEVLRTVANRNWQGRWFSDITEPGITTIRPRSGLFVHVRLWIGEDVEEFTIVSITDIDEPGED